MKKFIIKCIACIMTAVMFLGISAVATEPQIDSSFQNSKLLSFLGTDFNTVLENENYALSYKASTAEVAVLDKKTENVWYSNPQGTAGTQTKAQIVVYYYQGQDFSTIDSYSACVALGNEIITSVENQCFTVAYSINEGGFSADALPRVLTKERMEKDILPKLSKEDREVVLKRYTLYSRDKLDENSIDSIKLNFPTITKYDLYIRNNIPDYIAEEVYNILRKADYTMEDLSRDCEQNQIENTYKEKPYFNIELVYSLSETGLTVELDPSKIDYQEGIKPCRIDLLPYFGAQGIDASGYMFVPDGCGAIINFNNGKHFSESYWKRFFNYDGALSRNEIDAACEESLLPVFAISYNGGSFLATVDNGYEAGGISAKVAYDENSYNYIHPFFDIFSTDSVSLSSNSLDTFILNNKEIFSEKISVSYHFSKENATYTDLALNYREYLLENNILSKDATIDDTELNIDLIGTARVKKSFFGISYETVAALTDYTQAKEIIVGLADSKISVFYKNALKGGARQKKADSIKLQSILGSKKELMLLKDNTESFGVSYYGQRASSLSKKNNSLTLSSSIAKLHSYNIISRYMNSADYMKVVSPSKLESYAGKVVKSLKSAKINSVNLLDLGYELNSDFNEDNEFDRAEARKAVQAYLEALSKSAKITAEKGSIFSLPYLSKIKSIPTTSSGYLIEDAAVPFYQIAISGLISYSTPSINASADSRAAFLRTVELGGQLQYTWIYMIPENISDSYEDYYKYIFKNTYKQAEGYVKEYMPLYNKIKGHKITSHTAVSEGVFETCYENGIKVLVNYNETDVIIDGVQIGAFGFAVKE